MKRNRRLGMVFIAAVLIVVAALATIGYYFIQRGFSARGEPSSIEAFFARRVRRLAMPTDAREAKNPVPLTPEVLSAAKAHWADHCASCHDNDGRGKTLYGKGLYPKPPDMTQADTQQLTDGEIYYVIHNGIRFTGMPAFGEETGTEINDEESWALVHFIRYLPKMSEEEAVEMKKMNPKSPAELAKEERMRKFLEGDDSPIPEKSPVHTH